MINGIEAVKTLALVELVGDYSQKTNITPANRPSQKENSISTIHFQVLCSFQGG